MKRGALGCQRWRVICEWAVRGCLDISGCTKFWHQGSWPVNMQGGITTRGGKAAPVNNKKKILQQSHRHILRIVPLKQILHSVWSSVVKAAFKRPLFFLFSRAPNFTNFTVPAIDTRWQHRLLPSVLKQVSRYWHFSAYSTLFFRFFFQNWSIKFDDVNPKNGKIMAVSLFHKKKCHRCKIFHKGMTEKRVMLLSAINWDLQQVWINFFLFKKKSSRRRRRNLLQKGKNTT